MKDLKVSTKKVTIQNHGQSSQSQKTPKVKKKKSQQTSTDYLPKEILASQGGAHDEVAKKIADKTISKMRDADYLSTDGKASTNIILNPCGEHGDGVNAKFPDGTLSQSGVQRFRQFVTINPPWGNTNSSPNTTDNWALTVISPPAYKNAAILLASRNNSEPTEAETKQIFEDFNAATPPVWPAWKNVPGLTNFYYSCLNYKSANLQLNQIGGSRKIESLRLVGDGMVVHHNTPTLWDQGSVAAGQFQSDVTEIPAAQNVTTATVTVTTGNTIGTAVCSITYAGPINNGVLMAPVNATASGVTGQLGAGITQSFLLENPNGNVFANYTGTQIATQVNFVAAVAPNGAYYVFSPAGQPLAGNLRVPVSTVNTTYTAELNLSGQIIEAGANNPNIVAWTLPSLSQENIVQADPKFSAELMKDHGGVYCVRRYFEPVLNMTDTSQSGFIKAVVPGILLADVNGPAGGLQGDVFDKNGAVMVIAIRGISQAANPTIKMCRYVEFMPSPGSDLAPFVGPCPEKDEDAVEVFRQMQISGPHSYIPDANALGLLASLISTVVGFIPTFMRGARSFSHAVAGAVDFAETHFFSKVPNL